MTDSSAGIGQVIAVEFGECHGCFPDQTAVIGIAFQNVNTPVAVAEDDQRVTVAAVIAAVGIGSGTDISTGHDACCFEGVSRNGSGIADCNTGMIITACAAEWKLIKELTINTLRINEALPAVPGLTGRGDRIIPITGIEAAANGEVVTGWSLETARAVSDNIEFLQE